MAQDFPAPAASLTALGADLAAQLTGQGVDLTGPVPSLPKSSSDFEWSCESLSAAAHALYQLSQDAIAAHDIPTATHYYQAGHVFEEAHNAQCPEV